MSSISLLNSSWLKSCRQAIFLFTWHNGLSFCLRHFQHYWKDQIGRGCPLGAQHSVAFPSKWPFASCPECFRFLQIFWVEPENATIANNALISRLIVLRSEIPSGMRAKLRTAAASNNRDHPMRSLSSSPLASTINCSPGSQALLEVTHQGHTIGITLLLLVRAT